MKIRVLTNEEAQALDRLAYCTTGADDRAARIEDAVTIAQCGGIEDRMLVALLHLGAAQAMTPGVVRVLHEAGIDTSLWGTP